MPVQFVCPKCNQLLSVGSRKIGMEVNCPRCQRPVIVPTREAGAVSVALRQSARTPEEEPPLAEFIVYDDVPSVNEATSSPAVGGPALSKLTSSTTHTTGNASDSPLFQRAPHGEFPDAMLLLTRRGVYVQGALLALVALGALLAGIAIGYGLAPAATNEAGDGTIEEVVVHGLVQFEQQGAVRPDSGSVVIAVPDQNIPEPRLPVAGLRPADAVPAAAGASVAALERVGGAVTRADGAGEYRLTLSKPGRYMLAMISRHTERPASEGIDEFELAVMKRSFDRPEQLVGRSKFVWKMVELAGEPTERSHNFGQSGTPKTK